MSAKWSQPSEPKASALQYPNQDERLLSMATPWHLFELYLTEVAYLGHHLGWTEISY